ncbi:MAG TPA: hypothetical protein VGQ39_03425 [Pyrinomonadaceae bacterium]|jgi:hypothetical protein|nr:hypothetical protein [Pyrinomonadaceae bacterium]
MLHTFADLSAELLEQGWDDKYLTRGWATQDDLKEMADTPGAIFAAAWGEAVTRKAGNRADFPR